MNRNEIVAAIKEIQADSKNFKEKNDPLGLFNKYGVFFLGENFNMVFSHEIASILKKYFHIELDDLEFLKEIPGLCTELGMTFSPMGEMFGISASCYEITLW